MVGLSRRRFLCGARKSTKWLDHPLSPARVMQVLFVSRRDHEHRSQRCQPHLNEQPSASLALEFLGATSLLFALPGPPVRRFHSSESVQHLAFYKYLESYPRKNESPQNCSPLADDE